MMKVVVPFLVTCFFGGEAVPDTKNRPVTKVINLLKDMQNQLQKEAEEDEDVYAKMSCWCETNDKEKTQAIQDAEAKISELTSKIEQTSATSARLSAEIEAANAEVAENQAALDQATKLREEQLASFNKEEKDLLQSISALKQAITVLSKHHSSGFLQVPRARLLGVAATLQHELDTHASLLVGVLTPSQRQAAHAFVQEPTEYFDAEPTFKQSYAPQSGQIFGILRQMKDEFESNLKQSQGEEASNQKAFEELKSAKEAEIAAGQTQVDTKTSELADTDKAHAQAKQDIKDTKASLSADEQFLMMLKEKCQVTDQEWDVRQKARQEEIEAVSKALTILSSDDAHEVFTRSFNFLQTAGASQRAEASRLLAAAARQARNPRLAALATQAKLDSFTRVKKAIDDMIKHLKQEDEDEVKKRDFCTNEFHENAKSVADRTHEHENLKASIASLDTQIGKLTDDINLLNQEIGDLQTELKKQGQLRDEQNQEFQKDVADQKETQRLLSAALEVLRKAYPGPSGALVQETKAQGPPPPAGFKTYEKNAASGGVTGLIERIISDSKALETDYVRGEQDAQAAYEAFVRETNGSIEAKNTDVTNKSEARAQAEQKRVETNKAKDSVEVELEQLGNTDSELHSDCDFLMDNFDLRQAARAEEIKALGDAKSILSGSGLQESMAR